MRTTRAATAALVAACLFVAGCGGGGGGSKNDSVTITAPAGGGPATLTVDAHDIYFSPKTVKAPAGKIDIHYVEQGSQQHTFLIEGVKDFKLEVGPSKKSDDGSVDLKAGEYSYYCDIPGHRAQGMEGTITAS